MDPSTQVYYFDDLNDQDRLNINVAANQTLGSGVSAYYSPAGSKISNSRPAGSCFYDSRQDLTAYSTAIPPTCLHKQWVFITLSILSHLDLLAGFPY